MRTADCGLGNHPNGGVSALGCEFDGGAPARAAACDLKPMYLLTKGFKRRACPAQQRNKYLALPALVAVLVSTSCVRDCRV